ncbi:hypothetical protein HY638_00385 [Candidatus Woesearchaeota archaeon]|nr:hypothetical protein [Candidatus Woesearchaeota archaeon]
MERENVLRALDVISGAFLTLGLEPYIRKLGVQFSSNWIYIPLFIVGMIFLILGTWIKTRKK